MRVSILRVAVLVTISIAGNSPLRAQAPTPSGLPKKIEAYLRHMFAFGPDVTLTVPEPKESEVPGLLVTTIDLSSGESHDTAKMYVSKDGKYLFRGDVTDMGKDPIAEQRAKIDLKDAPSTGNPSGSIVVVEFADFECPVCRQLHEELRTLLPKYPQVKFYFKDFPIEQIHPWAKTAALASRCAYMQKPAAFWKFYDAFYDGQELISAANAWDKAVDFAGQAGLDQAALRSCLAAPEAVSTVDASIANAKLLEVNSTPTLFVNGRRVVGADVAAIERLIQYELAHQKLTGAAAKP